MVSGWTNLVYVLPTNSVVIISTVVVHHAVLLLSTMLQLNPARSMVVCNILLVVARDVVTMVIP